MAKDWEAKAKLLWPELIKLAKSHKQKTYGELAPLIDVHHQSLGSALGPIQDYCQDEGLPALTAVVINKDSRKPGSGFKGGSINEVYDYPDWDKVKYPASRVGKVTLKQFISFVRHLDGEVLTTLTEKKRFRIEVGERSITYSPAVSGNARPVSFKPNIQRYLDAYNGGARKTTQFYGYMFRTTSYFRAIMAEYNKPQNRIFHSREKQTSEKLITEVEVIAKARKGQGKFRQEVLQFWGSCAVTGVLDKDLLRASHIKPWRDADNPQRLDKYNGLLLTPDLDLLFDCGLITFADDGRIKIAPAANKSELKKLGVYADMRLRKIDEKHKPYLRYHREKVFRK